MGKAGGDQPRIAADDPLNPFKDLPAPAQGSLPDYYGAFSVNIYPTAPKLLYSHDDAGGWIYYLSRYAIPNFWFQDSLVTTPWYYEPTDHTLDTYGIDAVLAAYHSGHGGTSDGFYVAAMGAAEDDEPPLAFSNRMVLGNQRVNYIFWATCQSLLINETQNPPAIWDLPDRGFRMLFGFNSTSLDDPNYGRYFWEEWQKGKSFSRAWLDAAWRISIGMSPSAAAVGGNEDEAMERFTNERYFQADHAAKNNWVWGWYQSAAAAPECAKCPGKLLELEPVSTDIEAFRYLAIRFKLSSRRPVRAFQGGGWTVKDKTARLVQESTGAWEYFADSKRISTSASPISTEQVRQKAEEFIRSNGWADELIPIGYRRFNIAGNDLPAFPVEQSVVYAQSIEGVPVISSDAGQLTVTVDASGQIVQVRDTRRKVKTARPVESSTNGKELDKAVIVAKIMEAAKKEASRRWEGDLPELNAIPGTTFIGYMIEGDRGYFGASAEIDAVFPNQLGKRFKVSISLCK